MKKVKREYIVIFFIFFLLINASISRLPALNRNPANGISTDLSAVKAFTAPVWAQWYRIYGNSVKMIVENNSVILLGNDLLTPAFDKPVNPFAMKINEQGNLLWAKSYYGNDNYSFTTGTPLSNGHYLAAGNIRNKTGNAGVYIMEFDRNGNPVWGEGYYTKENESLNFITRVEGENYIVGGSLGNGRKGGWLFSIDSEGKVLWSKYYYMGEDTLFRNALIHQNSIIVAGEVRNGHGSSLFLAQLNFTGNIIWCRNYNEIMKDTKIILKSVGDQIWVFATIPENNGDIIFLKLDSNGQILGAKRYGTYEEEQIGDVAVINGYAVILGSSMQEERVPFIGNVTYVHNISNLLLFKIEDAGNILWQHLYHIGESFYGVSISPANNGYYFAANGKGFLPEFGKWRVPAVFKVNKYGGIGFLRNSSMQIKEINLEKSNIDVSVKEEEYFLESKMLEVKKIFSKVREMNISSVCLSYGYSPPLPPTNLSANVNDGKIYMSWKSPVDNGGLNITSYKVYRSEEGKEFVKIAEIKNTTYVDTVEKGKKYKYYVTAVNEIGESKSSNVVVIYVPPEESILWSYIGITIGIILVSGAVFIYLRKRR